MLNDINKVIISGRFVKDPEMYVSSAQKGNATTVARFVLASNTYMGKDKNPIVAYVDCVAYNKMADFIVKWFKKGDEAFIVGKIKANFYPSDYNPSGKTKLTSVTVQEIYFGAKAKNNRSKDNSNATQTDDFVPMPTDDDIPAYEAGADDLPF